jgi:hypothetical protein
MSGLAEPVRTRLLPALLTAIGVTLLAAGALSVTTPVTADAQATPTPAASGLSGPTGSVPVISIPPLGSGEPSASPSIPPDRVATRVRIAALRIDLPVILQETRKVPCDVAMYFDDPNLGQPGEGRATYLYAHARKDMFLPLLDASEVKNGKKLLGMIVEVWTSDDQHFLYELTKVKRHVAYDKGLEDPLSATEEELWLQTSEGVGTAPKLQVVGRLLSQGSAEHAAAHPKAKPVICT